MRAIVAAGLLGAVVAGLTWAEAERTSSITRSRAVAPKVTIERRTSELRSYVEIRRGALRSPVDPIDVWIADGVSRLAARECPSGPASEFGGILSRADVVLVGDLHQLAECRRVCRRVICAVAGSSAPGLLLLEALPCSSSHPGGSVKKREAEHQAQRMEDAIRSSWMWPTTEYQSLLQEAIGHRWEVACAYEMDIGSGPGREVSDEDWELGLTLARTNLELAQRIEQWKRMSSAARGPVVALVGSGHLRGSPRQVVELVEARGLGNSICIVFDPEWELVLLANGTEEALESWYEVLPGVYRAPQSFVSAQ